MSHYDHSSVQNYVVSLLRHYGFEAKKEHWISRKDRVDVAGWCVDRKVCNDFSIAVEISRKADLAKDLAKLLRAGFDIKFIIILKPYGKIPPVEEVKIVDLEEFEHYLRYLINVPPSYPLLSEKLPMYKPPVTRTVGMFKRYIVEELGFPELLNDILKVMLKAHALGEIPTKTVYIPLYSNQASIGTYEDARVINLLRQINIIREGGRGAYADGKVFLASLTSYGEHIAREISIGKVSEFRNKVENIISKYGHVISFIASLKRRFHTEEFKYEEILGKIFVSEYEIDKAYEDSSKTGIPSDIILFTEHISKLPKVAEKCLEFMKEFEKYSLSFIGPTFGSRGQHIGDVICLLPELSEYILRRVKDNALSKLERSNILRRFNSLIAVYSLGDMAYRGIKINSKLYDKIIVSFRVSVKDLKALVDQLHTKGITSNLLDHPPYITVIDRESFVREILGIMKTIEDKILFL